MSISRRDFIKASAASAALAMAGIPVEALADSGITYGRAQCRFCGVGCTTLAGVREGKVVAIKGDADSPINFGRLCMKGYSLPHIMYGEDRLKTPMVRASDGTLVEASWDEALDRAAEGFRVAKEKHGRKSVYAIASGRAPHEAAYSVQKFIRAGFATNYVDNCSRA